MNDDYDYVIVGGGSAGAVLAALRAGADGYATKEIASADLTIAIRRLHVGGRYLSAAIAERPPRPEHGDPTGPCCTRWCRVDRHGR